MDFNIIRITVSGRKPMYSLISSKKFILSYLFTDTMLVTSSRLMTSKRASTLRTSSQLPNQQPPFQTMQPRMMLRPNIVENPLEEPIYHTLDDNETTVYINADLEVVYPAAEEEGGIENDSADNNMAELNGLLADCNYDSDYVPSPAPGSIPRYASQLRTPGLTHHHGTQRSQGTTIMSHGTPSRRGQGYLV